MHSVANADPAEDLSALAWVHDELRRTLESALKALRRYVRESRALASAEIDAPDPAVLRQARALMHQGAGALDLVGQSVPALVLRAGEGAVQRIGSRGDPADDAAVQAIERLCFAVLDYLKRLLGGRAVSALALFPAYSAVQALAGVTKVHPADLWSTASHPARWVADTRVPPRAADARLRGEVERQVLNLMKSGAPEAGRQLSDTFASLAAGVPVDAPLATTWRLGAACFEALAAGRLGLDLYTKRAASGLLSLVRRAEGGVGSGHAGLERELMYLCALAAAEAGNAAAPTPRLQAACQALGLAALPHRAHEDPRLGRFDPAWLPLARKRVVALKDTWSGWAAGEARPFALLAEQSALVAESMATLFPGGDRLGQVLQAVMAAQPRTGLAAAAPEVALEVATVLLYVEASLNEAELDRPELGQHVEQLTRRLDTLLAGRSPGPIEPWMEALYREVSDQQTIGSVVQELRTGLSEVEAQLDRHARKPGDGASLSALPAQLASLRGVLSVLGLDHAAQAMASLRDDVETLAQAPSPGDGADVAPADPALLDRLADNLGALGFMVDMLGVQPHLARTLFTFDPDTRRFGSAVAPPRAEPAATPAPPPSAGAPPAVPDLADEPPVAAPEAAPEAALDELSIARVAEPPPVDLGDLDLPEVDLGDDPRAVLPPEPEPWPPTPEAAPGDDEDMRAVFLEESREVLGDARVALGELAEPGVGELGPLTALRRAFHTLKGSARMVGLTDFGEAAWAFEQVYNTRLVGPLARSDEQLRARTGDALRRLARWVEGLEQASGDLPSAEPFVADSLWLREAPPQADPVAQAVPDLADPSPAESDDTAASAPGDLVLVWPDQEAATAAPHALPPPAAQPDDLELEADAAAADPMPAGETADLIADFASALDAWQTLPPPLPSQAPAVDIALDLGALDGSPEDDDPPSPSGADLPPLGLEALPSLDLPAPRAADTADAVEAPEALPEPEPEPEQFKQIGELRVSIPLFNIYLNEADEWSRHLCTALAEWTHEPEAAPQDGMVATAHSLAGSSATVGYTGLSDLSRSLEHALERIVQRGHGQADELPLLVEAGEQIRYLLHQFAAGFLKAVPEGLQDRLELVARVEDAARGEVPDEPHAAFAPPAPHAPAVGLGGVTLRALADVDTPAADEAPVPAEAPAGGASGSEFALADLADLDAADSLDPELYPIFADEAEELLPRLAEALRAWAADPDDRQAPQAALRCLHTLKGSARLAGAMRLGEMAHRLEGGIEATLRRDAVPAASLEALQAGVDLLVQESASLMPAPAAESSQAEAAPGPEAPMPAELPTTAPPDTAVVAADEPPVPSAPVPATPAATSARGIDWAAFSEAAPAVAADAQAAAGPLGAVRVRSALLDRLVGHAGEVSIARAKLESDLSQIAAATRDLSDNLERLRRQLRDIELQGETQIASRMEAAKASAQGFDPLELDRFTRFQELTRMMAESVNDVATVQRSLAQSVQAAEDDLTDQARSARALQDDLLRARMVEFDSLAERLYRVVRQAARECDRQVRLDIEGGSIEIDRGVLERLAGCFEHLLRNAVAHGIEAPADRVAAGKPPVGVITIALTQEGNEVSLVFRDDGAGLDLPRIRERAQATGLLEGDAPVDDAALAAMIFRPGFSTASRVTELAGRGIGMDVVRSEVTSLGGRIETATTAGRGTAFSLVVPLTTAVTQVVVVRCGPLRVAVPASLVELVRRVPVAEAARAHAEAALVHDGQRLPFYWLGSLLQAGRMPPMVGRTQSLLVVRSAAQRVALHVDQIVGQQEVVIKHLGPQLARLPGLAGISQLASGEVVLIYNPVALAALYGAQVHDTELRLAAAEGADGAAPMAEAEPVQAPLVLVVDDSLTVRRVTQRLLAREGYRVALAKDGVDAIDRLADERPNLLLTDIEMPRMDGFDLVRHVRATPGMAQLPIVMITSRIAGRHREHALELGVDHYLGKPYAEEELLTLVRRHAPVGVT